MSEMVMRVARAIESRIAVRTQRAGSRLERVFVNSGLYDLDDVARAAIEAMREPTEEMTHSDSASDPNSHDGFLSAETLGHVWRCMCKEALK